MASLTQERWEPGSQVYSLEIDALKMKQKINFRGYLTS